MTEVGALIDELRGLASPVELPKVRGRLADDEPAFGLRMRDLFAVAEAHRDLPLPRVGELLDHPAYEPRMAAFCILDFKARQRLGDDDRRALCAVYVDRHDRITTWDMVDRAAPRVVGESLLGGPYPLLHELAAATDPLRRRTAVTAPLSFVRRGTEADLQAGFAVAERLAADPEPAVHHAVGIFLKHAGARDPARLDRLLDEHAAVMPRAGLRLAVAKLAPEARARHLARS